MPCAVLIAFGAMRSSGVRWLTELDTEQRAKLLTSARRHKVRARAVVVRRGDPADEIYLVVRGRLKVSVVNESSRETTFEILAPDDVFGEVGLFAGGQRTADVTAMEDCELLALRRADLLLAIRNEPSIGMVLLRVMAEHIASLSNELEQASSLSATTRFARCLCKLAERFGVELLPRNLQIRLKLSQQDLADLIGVSRVFANGCLRSWARAGVLTHRAGQLTVHDLPALRRLAGMAEA